jgi:nucleoside-diphosphate-sugar epimerase
MQILVTGATGFLGTPLVHRLCAQGATVRILARSAAKAQPLCDLGVELVTGTIDDPEAVRRAVTGVTTVYHMAGQLFTPGTLPAEYERTHVVGTRILLAACQSEATVRRFVHCSTTGVLGVTGPRPADERTPFHPTNAYERTKAAAESLVHIASREGLEAVVVRPGLVYGPGDLHLLGFFRTIQRGLFRPIGRRPVWLHPIYIDDMTEALLRCGVDRRAPGHCFHIAGQEPVTIAALARAIAESLDAAPPRGTIPLPLARAVAWTGDLLPARLRSRAPLTTSRLDFLTHSRVYDVRRAERLLDFVAATPLRDGLARTVAWYREHHFLAVPHATPNAVSPEEGFILQRTAEM